MTNPFDQFDGETYISGDAQNPFDQFDKPKGPSFSEGMRDNFNNAIQNVRDVASGNYEDTGRGRSTPKTEALADKLFPMGQEPNFRTAVHNVGGTDASDWTGALLEKFNNSIEGKLVGAIGGLHPLYNAASTVMGQYINPAIEEATGIHPDNLQAIELAASPLGLKGAKSAKDPLVSVTKAVAGRMVGQRPIAERGSISSAAPAATQAVTPSASKKVYTRLAEQFQNPADLENFLKNYATEEGLSLAEAAGAPTRNLAEGASQFPAGAAQATDFFKKAIDVAPDKLKGSINKNISPNVKYYETLDSIVSSGREQAAPLYKEAFRQNQSISSPVINKILATPEGLSALREAAKNMQNEMSLVARPDPEMTALAKDLADIGMMERPAGGVGGGLKLRTLDYIKRAMDSTINSAYRAGDEGQARRIIALKNGLISEVDATDKSGMYAKARAASGDYFKLKDAMESGATFLRDDPEIVQRSYASLSPAEQKAYRVGVMKSLRDKIDGTTDGHNVATFLGKKAMRNKLQSILSDKEFKEIVMHADAVDGIYKLRNQLTGNSRTMLRKAAMDDLTSDAADVVIDVATKGPTSAATSFVISVIKKKFSGLNDKSAGDVAKILFETNPREKYEIVKRLAEVSKSEKPESRLAVDKLNAFFEMSDAVQQRANPESIRISPADTRRQRPK